MHTNSLSGTEFLELEYTALMKDPVRDGMCVCVCVGVAIFSERGVLRDIIRAGTELERKHGVWPTIIMARLGTVVQSFSQRPQRLLPQHHYPLLHSLVDIGELQVQYSEYLSF